MSFLNHAQGNLLDMAEAGQFDVIVQGCNCFNTMGAGIAREIAKRFPQAMLVDDETVRGDYNKLGNYTSAKAHVAGFEIVNAYTQYSTSVNGEDVFEYVSFAMILQKLTHVYGTQRIGLPYIGMGLAGGDRNIILEMIEEFADNVAKQGGSVTLVEFA
jgi:O-acetyl-ADP-ribose deacetylase (regulator of RNase III)